MTVPVAEMGVPGRTVAQTGRVPLWPSIVGAFAFVGYFVWAGRSYDPRLANFWALREGWSVLSPGLLHQAIACIFLLGALTLLAARARRPLTSKVYWQVMGMVLLLGVAAWARWSVLREWQPFSLEPAVLSARRFTSVDGGWRAAAFVADLVTTALLMAILWARKAPGGYWLAALFALHPAVLSQGAGNGTWINVLLPMLVLVAGMSPRLKPQVVMALSSLAGVLCIWWVAHRALVPSADRPFNGFLAQLLEMSGASFAMRAIVLISVCCLGVFFTLLTARQARWDLARSWIHLLTLAALCSSTLWPADLLPLIALLPLALTAAGWALAGTVLSVYLAVFTWQKGTAWQLPFWIVCVSFVPVWVAEMDELLMAPRRAA